MAEVEDNKVESEQQTTAEEPPAVAEQCHSVADDSVPTSTALALPPVAHETNKEKEIQEVGNEVSREKSVTHMIVEKNSEASMLLSNDRDKLLAQVVIDKKMAFIKAWENREKTKAENKAGKKMAALESWELKERAFIEAKLKKIEEKLERRKAEYTEKMKNKIAEVHKEAEEKRAMIEAICKQEHIKIEDMASKFRSAGSTPKKSVGCFNI